MSAYTVTVEFNLHADSSERAEAIIGDQLTSGTYVGVIVNVDGDDGPLLPDADWESRDDAIAACKAIGVQIIRGHGGGGVDRADTSALLETLRGERETFPRWETLTRRY